MIVDDNIVLTSGSLRLTYSPRDKTTTKVNKDKLEMIREGK